MSSHSLGGSGEQQLSSFQREYPREAADQFSYREDQLAERSILMELVIEPQLDLLLANLKIVG